MKQFNYANQAKLFNADTIEAMKTLKDKSVDLILADLPYGMTKMEWDKIIPFDQLWEQYERILTDNGNIVLFGQGKFSIQLQLSNEKMFRYKLIWVKNVPTGMAQASYRPMHYYEEILIFNNGKKAIYNPIKKERIGKGKACYKYDHYCGENNHNDMKKIKYRYDENYVNPSDVLTFNVVPNRSGKLHPTEKPLELLEYLINTYSNEGSIVLDNTMGSGSTGEAAVINNRKFIGIEISEKYFNIAKERLDFL